MSRTKSAIIVFVFLTVAIIVAMNIDYTDKYVANRFQKALVAEQFELETPFSLDAFLEYYDWDEVCIVIPGQEPPELRTQFGLPYKHMAVEKGKWCILFVKSYYVIAEIHLTPEELMYPSDLSKKCYERWEAIVQIVDDGGVRKIEFVGG